MTQISQIIADNYLSNLLYLRTSVQSASSVFLYNPFKRILLVAAMPP